MATKRRHSTLPRRPGVGCAILVVMSVLVAAAVGFTWVAGGAQSVRLPADPEPRSVELVLEKDAAISVWADVQVSHRGISHDVPHRQLPPEVDVEVTFQRGSQRQTLRCNPLEVAPLKRSSFGVFEGVQGRQYEGPMESCAYLGQAGVYRVTVRRVPRSAGTTLRFHRLDAILRY